MKFKFKKNIQYPKRMNKIQRGLGYFKAARSRRQKINTDTEELDITISFLVLIVRELDIQERRTT